MLRDDRKRGQIESSFQWVFVLVAGTSLLILLFFFVRSCTSQGAQEVAGLSTLVTSQRIERASWQPDGASDLFVGVSDVSCTGGRVTFTAESGAASLDRASAFLPPHLSGTLHAVVRRITISEAGSPSLEFGSALLGIDGATHYLIVSDASGGYAALTQIVPRENRKTISVDDLLDANALWTDVPRDTRTLIIVSNKGDIANADLSDVPASVDVRGVVIGAYQAGFYAREGDHLALVRSLPVEHELLALGAAISGDDRLYVCGHKALEDRSLMLAHLYGRRAQGLVANLASNTCKPELSDAAAILNNVTDLKGLLDAQRQLSGLQLALLNKACPVIA